ncbi:MAG TPA: MMPL family transporter [Gaiellaceae bacterium]|nr:MMPL family transporter [Gaiellaceae bacterium]
MTQRLAMAAARHPWRTVGAWIAAVVVSFGLIAFLLGDALTGEAEQLNNPESQQAYDLIAERLPATPGEFTTDVVLIRSDSLNVDQPPFQAKIDEVIERLDQTPGVVNVVDEPAALTGDAAVIEVGLEDEGAAEDVVEFLQRDDDGAFELYSTGEWTVENDFAHLSQEDLETGELQFGLPVALVVLLLVFGAVVAGLVPLVLALVAIIAALGLTALVGIAFDLSIFTVNMLSGMGLALGIDYSLFVVSRFREERSAGRDKLDAIAATGTTASRAVLFSGVAFVIAMFGLLIIPNTIFRSLAAGAILVGITSVLAALTLLPAVLSLLGDRVNSLRIPIIGRGAERGTGAEGRFWGAIVRGVMRRPVVSLVLSVAVLLALASALLAFQTGEAGIRTMPDRFPSKQGFIALEREFGVGTTDNVQVVVDGPVTAPATRSGIERVAEQMRANRAFRQVETELHRESSLALIEATPAGDSRDERALDAVRELRKTEIPGARVLVTGETAESIDYFALTDRWLPILIVFVLSLSFILLTIAFRSLVVAATAIALNLLSVGAAYGALILVFQEGFGNELLGFQKVDFIEAWVPLFLFAVLFGLSMDYTVFLLSRIRERYLQTGSNDLAVAHGIGSTARLITGAALIIIAVFGGFALGDLVAFQQMGFGVAVSLLIDATIIRSVLLPATMKLLGERTWYLPSWLQWLPDFHVEGGR